MIIEAPGIDLKDLTQKEKNAIWRAGLMHTNAIPFTLTGTVFSGDPTATTLGNTLRSICYAKYYLHRAGLEDVPTLCAGDDCIIFPKKGQEIEYHHAILDATSRAKDRASSVGQCVTEAILSHYTDAEFCSKWFFSTGSDVILTRDYRKLLATKQYYSKKNAALLGNPALHRKAVLRGLETERASALLEDLLRVNAPGSLTEEELSLIRRSKMNLYVPEPTDY
jgi:hypothetical protein